MASRRVRHPLITKWISGSISYEDDQLISRITESLMASRKEGKFTDVSILVEDQTFPCHKFVIEANCPYFKAYFSFSQQSEELDTIHLDGVSPSAFKLILDFLYTAKITINQDNVQDLIQCADFLQCTEVTRACEHFLIPHISMKNCFELYKCSEVFSLKYLAEEARKFILFRFTQLASTTEFKSLPMETLRSIVSDDTLSVPTESNILGAILKWLVNDDSRFECADSLLDVVRWDYVQPCFLDGLREIVSREVSDKVMAAKERNRSGNIRRLKPVLGVFDTELATEISFYSEASRDFLQAGRCPFNPVTKCHCAQMGNSLYVTGGFVITNKRKKVTADVYKFDIATFKWEKKCPMKVPRYRHTSASLDGCLYVIGGENTESKGSQLQGEMYNSHLDQWSFIKCLPPYVNLVDSTAKLIPLQNRLFLMASKQNSVSLSYAYCYSPFQDSWTVIPELENIPMDVKTCCALKGLLSFFEPEYEKCTQHRRESRNRRNRYFVVDTEDDQSESERVDKISRLRVYNPLSRSLLTEEEYGGEVVRAEQKLNGGVVVHNDKLYVFRYTKEVESPLFMYDAELVELNLHGPTPRFRSVVEYEHAKPSDDNELCPFSGFTSPDHL